MMRLVVITPTHGCAALCRLQRVHFARIVARHLLTSSGSLRDAKPFLHNLATKARDACGVLTFAVHR